MNEQATNSERSFVDDSDDTTDAYLFEFLRTYYGDDSDVCDDYVESSLEQNETKKRRKCTYRRKNPLPRILKRDLRRDYSSMLVNTYNSGNPDQVAAFFRLLAVPTCTYVGYYPAAARVGSSNIRTASTAKGVIDLINRDLGLMPDFTFRFVRGEILQRQGMPGCKIIIEAAMRGTMCYEDCLRVSPESIHTHSSTQWEEQLRDCTHQESWVTHYYGTPPAPFVNKIITTVPSQPSLHRKYCRICMQAVKRFHSRPMIIQSRSLFTLTLDDKHRICTVELDSSPLPNSFQIPLRRDLVS